MRWNQDWNAAVGPERQVQMRERHMQPLHPELEQRGRKGSVRTCGDMHLHVHALHVRINLHVRTTLHMAHSVYSPDTSLRVRKRDG